MDGFVKDMMGLVRVRHYAATGAFCKDIFGHSDIAVLFIKDVHTVKNKTKKTWLF